VAAGVGTAITGRGAHILIIDDPLKDRKSADSETVREDVWNWYTSTAFTRLMPGGAIIVIQTRWHEDDLSGRLLESELANQWVVLNLPAISEDTEALWPEWYPLEELLKIKLEIGPRDWSALYMQQPTPDEGTYFQRDWIQFRDKTDVRMNIFGTSDYAVSEDKGDFTVHCIWGVDEGANIYLLDGWYGKTTSEEWIERKFDLVDKWKPMCWFGEGGVIRRALEPYIKRRMNERKSYCRIEWINSIADKPTRARAFQARAASGKVTFIDSDFSRWGMSQLLYFPVGKHDDFVDNCAAIGMVIDQAHPAFSLPVEERASEGSFARRFEAHKREARDMR